MRKQEFIELGDYLDSTDIPFAVSQTLDRRLLLVHMPTLFLPTTTLEILSANCDLMVIDDTDFPMVFVFLIEQ
jgi:hypothetical protein